jgi:hypothetical protein
MTGTWVGAISNAMPSRARWKHFIPKATTASWAALTFGVPHCSGGNANITDVVPQGVDERAQ